MNIRDPVHGQMSFSDLERKIIDLPQMQRLRKVRQVGLTYLVYPGALHTRFEHSLGTAHLASKMAERVNLDSDEFSQIRLAGLLHDVGHTPFSHDSEEILQPFVGSHEKIGEKLICHSQISDVLSKNYSPKKIASLAFGKSFGQLITCDVGADRLDYLLRDAHYTGVAYGVIDWGRILAKLLYSAKKGVRIQKGALEAAESIILARFSMFHTVYYHHAVRIARKMMQKALTLSLEAGLDAYEASAHTDDSLMQSMREFEGAHEYCFALENRHLLKRADTLYWNKLNPSERKYVLSGNFEADLQNKFPNAIVDLPSHFKSDANILIEDDKCSQKLSSISSISSSLEAAASERANLLVICPPEDCKGVCRATKRLL